MNVNLFCMSTTLKHLLHERKQCLPLFFKNYIYEFEHPFLGGGAMLETHGRFRLSYLEVRDARPTVGFRQGGGGVPVSSGDFLLF